MARRQPANEAQPVLQRLRFQYSKTGRMRFASHRDFQRSLERAIRRAGIPLAVSGGFSPRPRISYANAAPTGTASRAEYVELGLARPCAVDEVRDRLSAALPTGFAVVRVVEAGPGSLADRLEASAWQFEFPGVGPSELEQSVAQLLSGQEPVLIVRVTKKGRREIDLRTAWVEHRIWSMGAWHGSADEVADPPEGSTPDDVAPVAEPDDGVRCAILRIVVRHVTPAPRPDDILAALIERTELEPPTPVTITRLAQGPLPVKSGLPGDPLALAPDVLGQVSR